MKFLVLNVSGNSDGAIDADHAILELDSESVKDWLAKSKAAIERNQKDKDFSSEEFVDFSPSFVSYDEMEKLFGEKFGEKFNDDGYFVAEADFDLSNIPSERMDYCNLKVSGMGSITWVAGPKYLSGEISTYWLHTESLGTMAAEMGIM
jgi:hypothetical protein